MRQWINLFENNQTQTKDRTKLDIGLAPDSVGDLTVGRSSDIAAAKPVPGKAAGRTKTRAAAMAPMSPEAGTHLGNLAAAGLNDVIDDAEAARRAGHDMSADTTDGIDEPINPENLPQVLRSDMVDMGNPEFAVFEPEWHQVKHLPGYMQNAIRALGRAVFSPFTDTPIEDIQVLSTLSNPETDVKKMMKWITINGIRDDEAALKFNDIMPGYNADVKIYNTEDCQFMLVKDFGGVYIYGWPGGRGVALDAPAPMQRLEGVDDSRSNLKALSELMNPLAKAYHAFMEAPMFPDEEEQDPAASGQPAKPQGSGQSNSTTKPVAPGAAAPEGDDANAAAVPEKPIAGLLNPAQQAAKDKADTQKREANMPKL